ncbi:MAG: hypothetical protein HQL87_12620 [Magnetococcales bacterium]|nr:hypothetical protein [Magnetococcales bacterium]
MTTRPAAKRFVTALVLGVLCGLLCVFLAAGHQPELASPTNPLFWAILTDRILIGLVVALAGAFTVHPVLGFAYRPWLRGACLGAIVSLPLALGALSGPATPQLSPWLIFCGTLVSGAVYGAIIDWVATWVGGEGKALLTP